MSVPAKLRIGFNPDFAPLCHLDGDVPGGLVIGRAAEALAQAGLTPEWWPLALPMMMGALKAGDVDALAGVGVTAERNAHLAYSKPLVVSGGAWFALAETDWWSGEGPGSAPNEDGWRVVTPAAGPLVRVIRARFPALDLITCRTYDEALAMVAGGKAEAAALNWHVGRLQTDRDYPGRFALPAAPFVEIPLAIAAAAGAEADVTLRRLNEHIPESWGVWREPE